MKSYSLAKQSNNSALSYPTRTELKAATGAAVGESAYLEGLVTSSDGLQGQYVAVAKGGTPDDNLLLDGQGVDWQLISSTRITDEIAAGVAPFNDQLSDLGAAVSGVQSDVSDLAVVVDNDASLDRLAVDSGTSVEYILTTSRGNSSAYYDGMRVRFRPANTNTIFATLSIDGGAALLIGNGSVGSVVQDNLTEIEYVASSNSFRIVNTDPVFENDVDAVGDIKYFKYSEGVKHQWGTTEIKGDIIATSFTTSYLVPFVNNEYTVNIIIALETAANNGDTIVCSQQSNTTTLSQLGYRLREFNATGQSGYRVKWYVTGP